MKKIILFFIFISFSFAASSKFGKIEIFSDQATFDFKRRKVSYLGHVLIISPYFNATCEKADVFLDKNYNLLYIYGYENIIIENKNLYIKANFFFFDNKKKKLLLKGNVKITIKNIEKFKKRKKEKLNVKS